MTLPHYTVFVFGSRARGSADNRSDIDIGLDAGRKIPGDVFINIQEDLNGLPVLQKFDLVDFAEVTDDFRREALKSIEVIHEQ